jgi:hypothetical protein
MKTEIVIARYNEDLSWLKKIPKSIKITIYNKGIDDIENMKNLKNLKYNIIKLPNIGRESHTYLYHIINNYDKLADKTIFCQGDSIFHSPGFLDLLKNIKLFEPVQPLSAFYWPEGPEPNYFYNPPKPLLDGTKDLWIKKSPIHVEYMDNNFVTRYPYFYNQDHYVRLTTLVKKYYNIDSTFKFFVERFRLKNIDLDDLFPVCYAGLFCINKEVILENSIDFYNNIMSMLLYDFRYDIRYSNKSTKNIDWGLFLEKLWLVIFNYKKHNKNYIKLKIKDFPIYNYNLTINYNKNIQQSLIKFKLYIINSELYINLIIDGYKYFIEIMQKEIYLKTIDKTKLYINTIHNKEYHEKTKENSYIIVEVKLQNNNLIVIINNLTILDYKFFKYNVNKIEKAEICYMTNYNKFIDLLSPNKDINITKKI